MGVEAAAGETPSLTREFIGENHRGLECAQAHPLGNQHQKGPIWLWVGERVTENQQRVEHEPLLPLSPSPRTASQRSEQSYPALVDTEGSAPLCNRCTKTKKKKNGPNDRTEQSSRKNTLSNEKIANLSDAQFKTLVIRKLTELVEFGRKLDEKMKAMLRETKKMYREPIVMGRKL